MKKNITILLLTIVMITGIVGATVSAANITDTTFQFYVYTNGPAYTEERVKLDDSNTYVYIQELNYDYGILCNLIANVPQANGTYVVQDITANDRYAVLYEGQWEVRNDCNAANLWIKLKFSEYLTDTGVAGKWSPDCAGSYTVAN